MTGPTPDPTPYQYTAQQHLQFAETLLMRIDPLALDPEDIPVIDYARSLVALASGMLLERATGRPPRPRPTEVPR